MDQVVRIFFPAVFAAILLGTAPSGAADDPVATAPIPPPLPAEPLSPATPMMIPATTTPKPKTELPGPAAAAPVKKPETAAAPKQNTAPQKPEAQAAQKEAQKTEPAAGSPRQKPETTARASRPRRPISRQAARPASPPLGNRRPGRLTLRKPPSRLRPMPPRERQRGKKQPNRDASNTRAQGGRARRPLGIGRRRSPPTATGPMTTAPMPIRGPIRRVQSRADRAAFLRQYPRHPTFYGPAYPPPWYNGAPGSPPPEYYPAPWRGGPTPPW